MTTDIDELIEQNDNHCFMLEMDAEKLGKGRNYFVVVGLLDKNIAALKSLKEERDALREALASLKTASINIADKYNQVTGGATDDLFIELLHQHDKARKLIEETK